MKHYTKKYNEIITFPNILSAWNRFRVGKTRRADVNTFEVKILDNLHLLFSDLKFQTYKHSPYEKFEIIEVKKREINKASVRDRIVHQLLYTHLYEYFDKQFIYDSYSCRKGKGTHKALLRYETFFRSISQNFSKQVWVLKFDIRKCFESIEQDILLKLLDTKIEDKRIFYLCKIIITSFSKGMPLGNLTSQLFINVYLNELDRFVKHTLKLKYYIRYADDVVVFYENKSELEKLQEQISGFLKNVLKLDIHKNSISTAYSGVDFLGFKHFKKFRTLRKVTERKMWKKLCNENASSYLGMIKWGNCQKIEDRIKIMSPKL